MAPCPCFTPGSGSPNPAQSLVKHPFPDLSSGAPSVCCLWPAGAEAAMKHTWQYWVDTDVWNQSWRDRPDDSRFQACSRGHPGAPFHWIRNGEKRKWCVENPVAFSQEPGKEWLLGNWETEQRRDNQDSKRGSILKMFCIRRTFNKGYIVTKPLILIVRERRQEPGARERFRIRGWDKAQWPHN